MPDPGLPSQFLASVACGIACADRDLRYVYVNDAALTMLGLSREQVIGRTPRELFPAPLSETVTARAREALDGNRPVEYDVYDAASDRWYENRLFPWSGGVAAFFSDITERKRTEEALRHSEASHRALAEALRESRDVLALAMRGARMGAWSRNLVNEQVWWSRELEEIFGVPPGGFGGTRHGYLQFVHEDDRPTIDRAVSHAIETRTDYVVEFRFRHASGEWRWLEGRGAATYDSDGRALSLYGVGMDITARKHGEQALAEARAAAATDAEHLNIALAAAGLGDWRWDAVTDVVTMSVRAAEIFGIRPGPTMTWAEMRELLHPDDREAARVAVEHAVATRTDYHIEYRVGSRDRERWITSSGRPVCADDGRIIAMLGVVQDISHDRLLLRVDDAVRPMVNADAIAFTTAAMLGSHLGVNRCAYGLVEDDQDSFVLTGNYTSNTHSIVGRYRFSQFGEACVTSMRQGQPFVIADAWNDGRINPEVRQLYQSGAIRSMVCVPILKERRLVAALAVQCEAPRHWSPAEVQLVQRVASRCWESLERGRVEREREALLQAAQAANRAKDEFLAMLGHELRNPLSPILTALQLMRLRGDDTTRREREVIERQVSHLTRLVDDLLDVSRIARGKVDLKLEIVDAAAVIARAVETASPLLEAQAHQLHVDVPDGLHVLGDAARLTQVFSNLVMNAAKYTPSGGRIDVLVAVRDEDLEIQVRDTGVGIAAEMLPHIFDAFVQSPQRIDRAEGGLGLGLAIVRSLVERHGGSVLARSDGPGLGSEFSVRLPLAPEAMLTTQVQAETKPAARGDGIRVLVVDDNPDSAEMLGEALELYGFLVQTAPDAVTALTFVEAFQPEVALLDIGLPVMDGYELATRLRAMPALASMQLIAVTGYGQPTDRQRSAAAGFDEHLVKPVNVEQLAELISSRRV